MELEEKPEPKFNLPILPKTDRLDHLVKLLEDKYSLSKKHFRTTEFANTVEQEDHQRKLSDALNEVHSRGTIMERLEMLEKRVLELILNMVHQTYSPSSSSNLLISEKSELALVTKKVEDVIGFLKEKYKHLKFQAENPVEAYVLSRPKDNLKRRKRKWRALLGVICSHY